MVVTVKRIVFMLCVLVLLPSVLNANDAASKINPVSWDFKSDGDFLGWSTDGFQQVAVSGGGIKGLTNKFSFLHSPILALDAQKSPILVFTAKSSNYGTGRVYFRHSGEVLSDDKSLVFEVKGGNQFHKYTVDLSPNSQWHGKIEQIRLDILYVPNTTIEISQIAFRSTPATANPLNILLNGDFENSFSTQIDGWDTVPSNGRIESQSISGRGEVVALQAGTRNASVVIRQPVAFDFPGYYSASLEYLPAAVHNGDELALRLRFQDILGNALQDKLEWKLSSKNPNAWAAFKKNFRIPDKAAFGLIEVALSSKSGKSSIYLDNIMVRTDTARNAEAKDKSVTKAFVWSGEWIWVPGYTAADDASPMYFRKDFNLADHKEVDNARVVVSADNDCQLYVNGRELPYEPNHDTWAESDVYDIKPYLRSGENVLAVKAVNQSGPGGLILESGIHLRNKDVIYLKSDANWKCSKDGAGDWSAPGFDDTKWSKSKSFGKPPAGAWGDLVSYTYLGPCAEIAVKDISCPASVQPGSKVPFRLTLSSKNKLAPGASLFIDLAKSGTHSGVSVYKKDLGAISNFKQIDLKGEFSLEGVISGKYDLRISITNTKPTLISSTAAVEKDNFIIIPFEVLNTPKTAKSPKCTFKLVDGSPVLTIDGKVHSNMNYWIDNTNAQGLIKNCRDNGVHVYWLNIISTEWKGSGQFDFSKLDELCASVLAQNPDAYIVPVIPLDNVCNPGLKAWTESHEDDMARDSNGSVNIPDYGGSLRPVPSMASKNWLAMSEDLVRGLIRHVRSSRYADRVIGYMPGNGVTYEWQQWGSVAYPPVFVDYSEPARQAFVDWAKNKYADIEKLNASWNAGYGSFDEIQIPSKDERLHSDLFAFLDPAKSMREVDFRQYYADVVADDILHAARVVKEETNGESFCGVFYGYVTHVLGSYRYQLIGHSGLHKVLESPDIDFLMSPSDYSDRQIGGGSGLMSATGSVRLHDKVWIDQADLRTHHSTQTSMGCFKGLVESKAGMIRHFANALINGCSEQLYDFSTGWTSGDKRLMQLAGKLREIQTSAVGVDRLIADKSNTIAVIVDEKSTFYTAMASAIHHETVVSQYATLSRTGVGFDTYLLNDIDKIPDHRCYVFLNTFRITKEQQAVIDRKLKNSGKVLVFVYAPGITDEKSLSPDRISEITGIGTETVNKEMRLSVKVNKTDDPMLKYLPTDVAYGSYNEYGPVFIPKEGTVLGTIEGMPDKPGLVVKKHTDWTSVFSVAPAIPANLLRGIAGYAGMTITNPYEGDITYSSGKLVAVHTLDGGERRLQYVQKEGKVQELVSGKTYTLHDGYITVPMEPRSTYIFLTK